MNLRKTARPAWALPGLVLLLGLAVAALAQTGQTGQDVRQTVEGTVDARLRTQEQQDAWALEKDDLVRRYREAKASVGWLVGRREAEQQRVGALEGRVAELERRLAEADRLESSMQDTLLVIFGRLERSVDQSLPFLPQERRFRLETLTEELARPDIASAEKLRRVLESLQVEAGYAGSVEVYQDEIEVAGQILHADVLRLGRVALFWMTPDRKQAGVYDQGTGRWVQSPGSERRRIGLAMEMASRVRPVELIDLPLGRIAPQEGRP